MVDGCYLLCSWQVLMLEGGSFDSTFIGSRLEFAFKAKGVNTALLGLIQRPRIDDLVHFFGPRSSLHSINAMILSTDAQYYADCIVFAVLLDLSQA